MNKRQWRVIIILCIVYLIFFIEVGEEGGQAYAFKDYPNSLFWNYEVKWERSRGQRAWETGKKTYTYHPNIALIFLVWLTITGIGGIIIWSLREKKTPTIPDKGASEKQNDFRIGLNG